MAHRITELHNIMPISNIPSVLEHGILSHERVAQLPHADVSMHDVQERRNTVQIPNGLQLHQYANLYFDARNPMMYKRLAHIESLCVLSVSVKVLQLPNVVITDQNAASAYVRFYAVSMLDCLNFDWIYAENWTHPEDQIAEWRHKSAKCAEVLVPKYIPVDFIQKAYVVNEQIKNQLIAIGFPKAVEIVPRLFFR